MNHEEQSEDVVQAISTLPLEPELNLKPKKSFWKKIFHPIVGLIASLISFLSCMAVTVCLQHKFDSECRDYIYQAAKAPSILSANQNLDHALRYIEQNYVPRGVPIERQTDWYYKSIRNDLNDWNGRLVWAQEELNKTDNFSDFTVDRDLALINFRQKLLTTENGTEKVIAPENIYLYPYHKIFSVWIWATGLTLLISLIRCAKQ